MDLFQLGGSEIAYESLGVASDEELLVGGNYPYLYLAVGSGDLLELSSQTSVCSVVKLDAEVFHVVADVSAYIVGVLADTAGEDNSVQTVHYSGIRADELLDLIAEHFACELSLVVAMLCCVGDVAVIAGDTGNAEEARLLVHVVAHRIGGKTQLVCDEGDCGGVNAAAACAHDNAVQGSEAHGSIDGLAAFYSGDGGAVAEVAGNDLEILDVLAHSVSQRLSNEAVGGSVEAVLSYMQLLVALIGKTVHECLLRHCGVERGVEYNDLRSCCRDNLLAGSESECVGVVMYRCQFGQIVDLLDNFIGYQGGLAEYLSALYYSVTYCGDLAHAVDDLALAGGEYFNELFESLGVGGEGAVSLYLSSVKSSVLDVAVDTYTVAVALCNNALVLHIDQLVL